MSKKTEIGFKHDLFWADKMSILISQDRLTEFIPTSQMTFSEKLNAIVRFSVITAILLFIYNRDYRMIYFPLFVLSFTYFMYTLLHTNISNKNKDIENFKNPLPIQEIKKENTVPTVNNPFMNVLLTDYTKKNRKPAANSHNNTVIQDEIENKFESNLYNDVENVFARNNSQRQFYTNPSTTIPNDQTGFAEWLYSRPKSCKEGGDTQCVKNQNEPFLADTMFKNKYI